VVELTVELLELVVLVAVFDDSFVGERLIGEEEVVELTVELLVVTLASVILWYIGATEGKRSLRSKTIFTSEVLSPLRFSPP